MGHLRFRTLPDASETFINAEMPGLTEVQESTSLMLNKWCAMRSRSGNWNPAIRMWPQDGGPKLPGGATIALPAYVVWQVAFLVCLLQNHQLPLSLDTRP